MSEERRIAPYTPDPKGYVDAQGRHTRYKPMPDGHGWACPEHGYSIDQGGMCEGCWRDEMEKPETKARIAEVALIRAQNALLPPTPVRPEAERRAESKANLFRQAQPSAQVMGRGKL